MLDIRVRQCRYNLFYRFHVFQFILQMPITEKRIAKAIETDTNLGRIKITL